MRVEAVLKVCAISVGPRVPERLFFGYKRVQGGFEEVWMVRRSR
jgi:hypothetical protein